MLRLFFATILLAYYGQSLGQQSHSFGVQLNANINSLSSNTEGQPSTTGDLSTPTLRFDLFGSYDYQVNSWLGVNANLGLSARGGARSASTRRDLYYLSLPLRPQLKLMKFLWLEPGIELQYLLWHKDVSDFEKEPNEPFPADDLAKWNLNFIPGGRFNIYQGLSVFIGFQFGISSVAEAEYRPHWGQELMPISYKQFGWRLGLRYMFAEK